MSGAVVQVVVVHGRMVRPLSGGVHTVDESRAGGR